MSSNSTRLHSALRFGRPLTAVTAFLTLSGIWACSGSDSSTIPSGDDGGASTTDDGSAPGDTGSVARTDGGTSAGKDSGSAHPDSGSTMGANDSGGGNPVPDAGNGNPEQDSGSVGGMCTGAATQMGGLTYYDTPGVPGNCGAPYPANGLYAAMNTEDYDNSPLGPSGACGKCAEVTGPTGEKVIVTVLDQCPIASNDKCIKGHIDLAKPAFDAIVPGNLPRVVDNNSPIPWHYVTCPVTGPIVYHFDSSTGGYYIKVQIRNARYGIKGVKYRMNGGGWNDFAGRTDGSAWFVLNGQSDPGKLDLQVTDEYGHVLEDDGVSFANNGNTPTDAQGHANFPLCN